MIMELKSHQPATEHVRTFVKLLDLVVPSLQGEEGEIEKGGINVNILIFFHHYLRKFIHNVIIKPICSIQPPKLWWLFCLNPVYFTLPLLFFLLK